MSYPKIIYKDKVNEPSKYAVCHCDQDEEVAYRKWGIDRPNEECPVVDEVKKTRKKKVK